MLPSYLTLTLNEETGECVSWDLRIDKYNGVTYISIMANSKAPCKGKSLTTPIFLNPGTRIFHYIPHYIIPRMLYIPLQTNAWCDALSDCQYIAMFCPQRID